MAVLVSSSLLRKTGSMGDRRLRRHSGGGFNTSSSRPSCGSIVLGILLASIVMIPFILLGPNVVFSVNIAPRGEYGNRARSAGVRGVGRDLADITEERSRVAIGPQDNMASARETPPHITERKSGVDTASGAGDLCLGMAIGISAAQLVTFAASFREVAPVARLVMFFEAPTSDRFNDIIDKFGIIPLHIDRERLEPAVLRRYHPSSVRWTLIQRLLDMKGSDYERVLMIDAGQAFFQGNPFDIIGDPGIYAFAGDKLIGDSQELSTKIQNCLGSAVLAQLAHKPAIHSPVSLATSSFAIEYARQMAQGLVTPAFQTCEAAGVDSGLYNYLLHSADQAQGVQTFDQASGPVTDIQAGKYDNSDSRVVNLSGRVVPIVYRYVGNEELKVNVFRRYIYWAAEEVAKVSPISDATNMAARDSPLAVADQKKLTPAASHRAVANCEQFSLSEGFDLFKAICDHAHSRVRSLGDCCTACNGHRTCQAFSFDKGNGMCYLKNCDRAQAPGPSTAIRSITSGIKSSRMAQ